MNIQEIKKKIEYLEKEKKRLERVYGFGNLEVSNLSYLFTEDEELQDVFIKYKETKVKLQAYKECLEALELQEKDIVAFYKGKDIKKADNLLLETARNNFDAGYKKAKEDFEKRVEEILRSIKLRLRLTLNANSKCDCTITTDKFGNISDLIIDDEIDKILLKKEDGEGK